MATKLGQTSVTLEVQAAPTAFLQATPAALAVAKGSPAVFSVHVTPQNFAGPIYLRLGNVANDEAWSVNPIPAGGGSSQLTIDTTGWPVAPPFEIAIEAWDALPA